MPTPEPGPDPEPTPPPAPADAALTLYTAHEIAFMLGLRSTPAARVTGSLLGVPAVADEAREAVQAAVTSGLHARGKVEHAPDGQWLLGEEAQLIAGALTEADRWLGFALAEGEAMRAAFVVRAGQTVIMVVQDELGTFAVSAMEGSDDVPRAVGGIAVAFLSESPGRTVSLHRTEVTAPDRRVPLLLHTEPDGTWQVAHEGADGAREPSAAADALAVAPLDPGDVEATIARLWHEGVSAPRRGPSPALAARD